MPLTTRVKQLSYPSNKSFISRQEKNYPVAHTCNNNNGHIYIFANNLFIN